MVAHDNLVDGVVKGCVLADVLSFSWGVHNVTYVNLTGFFANVFQRFLPKLPVFKHGLKNIFA